MRTERVVTTSMDSSSIGPRSSAAARTKRERSRARSRHSSSRSLETSLKTTSPSSPTRSRAPNAISPSPQPTSSTTSPGPTRACASTRSRTRPSLSRKSRASSGSPPKRRSAIHSAQQSRAELFAADEVKDLILFGEAACLPLRENDLLVDEDVELAFVARGRLRALVGSLVDHGRETRGPAVVAASGGAVEDLDRHERQPSSSMTWLGCVALFKS